VRTSAGKSTFFRHDDERPTTDTGGIKNSPPPPLSLSLHTHHSSSALAVDIGNATSSASSWEEQVMSSDAQSYSQQYDRLFSALPLDVKKVRGSDKRSA
jgi:hypothetical protein